MSNQLTPRRQRQTEYPAQCVLPVTTHVSLSSLRRHCHHHHLTIIFHHHIIFREVTPHSLHHRLTMAEMVALVMVITTILRLTLLYTLSHHLQTPFYRISLSIFTTLLRLIQSTPNLFSSRTTLTSLVSFLSCPFYCFCNHKFIHMNQSEYVYQVQKH